jgi:hypothetical protein
MAKEDGKLRQSIPHAHEVGLQTLEALLSKDVLTGWFTEKTDGSAFEMGYDLLGFYTRTATSTKIRAVHGYQDALRARFGENYNPKIGEKWDHIHSLLQYNKPLQSYLKQKRFLSTSISGEVFYRPSAKRVDGMLQFETILYNPFKLGVVATFIAHTKMPKNQVHNFAEFKSLGNNVFKFDDDAVSDKILIDVSKERGLLEAIDKDVLHSRLNRNKEARDKEKEKLRAVLQRFSDNLRGVSNGLVPKWGYETEGYVFHPEDHSDIRVKVISDLFRANFDGRKYQNPERKNTDQGITLDNSQSFSPDIQGGNSEIFGRTERIIRS